MARLLVLGGVALCMGIEGAGARIVRVAAADSSGLAESSPRRPLGESPPATALERADRLWSLRARDLEGHQARPDGTERALAAYLAEASDALGGIAARWKALRAAHYLSEFTTASEDRRDAVIDEATGLAERSLAELARTAGRDSLAELDGAALEDFLRERSLPAYDVAQLHFWSAIVWGAQGQRVGFLTIVREGIARRMYDDTSLALRLDPAIERGGGYRLLSRLNAELPRVPFVSMWVDRDRALPQAERAYAIDPADPGNRLILAMALREFAPDRRAEAEALIRGVAEVEPRAELLAEDLAIREQARELIDEGLDPRD